MPTNGAKHSTAHLKERVFVIVPAYNEATVLPEVLPPLVALWPRVVVVDDGSSDDTARQARRHTPLVLRHDINRGQGASLQTGIEFTLACGAEFVVTFDADGQHDPHDIDGLLRPILAGECDVTLGTRFGGEAIDMPSGRRRMLRLAVVWTRLTSGLPVTDAHNGLRAFSRRAAQAIHLKADRMAHASELIDQICRENLRFREVPVEIRYTEYSLQRSRTWRDALRILLHYFVGKATR